MIWSYMGPICYLWIHLSFSGMGFGPKQENKIKNSKYNTVEFLKLTSFCLKGWLEGEFDSSKAEKIYIWW